MHQKQVLDAQNCELLRKLQLAAATSAQHAAPLPLHGSVEHSSRNPEIKENRTPCVDKVAVTADSFQQCATRQNSSGPNHCQGSHTESRGTTVPSAVDRKLVPCTTSPIAMLDACETSASVYSRSNENTASSLKRRMVDCTAVTGTDEKQQLFNGSSQMMG